MSSNKGITLVVLVVTIIILLILTGTATYVGYETIQNSAQQRFLNQLKEINEAVNLHSNDYKSLELIQETNQIDDITYSYILSSSEDFEKIGLYNITDTIYANFEEGLIYSKEGINGKHTLKDFGIEYYKPVQEKIDNNKTEEISFEVELIPGQYSWKYIANLSSIICNGEALEGNLLYAEYKEDGNYEWKRVNKTSTGFELEIKDPGVYELKYRDSTGKESNIKQIYAYIKDGLQLYYDGEYNENYKHNSEAENWIDLSGNNNNATLEGCFWTTENNLLLDGINDKIYCNSLNYNESTIEKLYLDYGQEKIASVSNIEEIITSDSTFDIGKYFNNNISSYYNGKIYLFRIYNRALSTDEIAINYKIDQIRFGEISKE